jgi:tRNA (mo5U34)-methyltransferase
VFSPGVADTLDLMRRAQMPDDLTGKSVLDIGTCNGGLAFEAERRGATRVVAVDIYPPSHFGFDLLAEHFGSRAQFVTASTYELGSVFDERFDVVAFFGVLYHLRHPLLGLDAVRRVASGEVYIETAVTDGPPGVVRFFRGREFGDDSSNWFVPTPGTVLDWCASAGLDAEITDAWGDRAALRAVVSDGPPEYETLSYEVALDVSLDLSPVPERRH